MTLSLPHLQGEKISKINFLKEKGTLFCFSYYVIRERDMGLIWETMKDNMGKLVWDWLGDARQRIECHSINIH